MTESLKHCGRILFFLILFLFCVPLKVVAAEQVETKNVLILNSYHQGLEWTSGQVDGIKETLCDCESSNNLFIEYMDWKNYPTDENRQRLYEYYKFKYENKPIDIIITTDDVALEFATEYRKEIFSDAPIVFSGINQDGVIRLAENTERVTGVTEVIDPTGTIELIYKINPSVKYLYVLYDNTESGLTTGEIISETVAAKFPNLTIIPMNKLEYSSVLKTVSQLDTDCAVMVTTYSQDVTGKVIEMDFVNRNISAESSVPVYHLYDFGLDNGTLGGVLLSSNKQGTYAAELALQILEGADIENMPVIQPASTVAVVDFKQMERFGINKDLIPDNVEIINKPFSFYETYKEYVIVTIAVIGILVCFISVLLIYIRIIQRMKKKLAESHEELTQLYEELTASEEEMRQQYDEILLINEKIRIGEEKLTFLAYHDMLTALPNKLSMYEKAPYILTPEREKVGLLFVDIDNFKNVNDTLGHAIGDKLIKKVSARLKKLFDDEDTIYHLSGDEFIIIKQEIKDVEQAQELANAILKEFNKEFKINGSVLRISVSIGIALYPDHGMELDQLLKYADLAMYKAKGDGKKNFIIYDSLMNEEFMERMSLEKHLLNALENNEFELYYQPQMDIESGRITGFEALLRWTNPELGRVSPLRFIKVAEETRYIIPLGTWVLRTACIFLKKLVEAGYSDFTISVNISVIQLLQSGFCDIVLGILNELELEPKNLELEITETVLMESVEQIKDELKRLHDINIKIALDDFGKGYSSLNYLRQLPISTLKVDKSFVDTIIDDTQNCLTGNIVTLGKSMGMCVIAEGVEEQEQLEYLKQYNCDRIQGYLFSKPLPESEVLTLLMRDSGAEVAATDEDA